MKKMIKGFAFVALLSASVVFAGCSKKSKCASLIDEVNDASIKIVEIAHRQQKKDLLEKFEKMSESEQDEVLKNLEEVVKEVKDKAKEIKKDPEKFVEEYSQCSF